MSTKPDIAHTEKHPNVAAGILKRVGTVAIFLVLIAIILFLAAGRLDWIWAWVYMGISLATVSVVGPIAIRTSPETVAERGEFKVTEKWDKVISAFYLLAMYIALPLVAGLDSRFGWTRDLTLAWHVAGAVLLTVGSALTAWAMITNAYFSTAVRIQSDRGQTVCTAGPYRVVRHPGYAGYILQGVGVPILLGSLWALILAIAAAASLVARTSLEDGMLQSELPGYRDYVQRVRFRLVPGIW